MAVVWIQTIKNFSKTSNLWIKHEDSRGRYKPLSSDGTGLTDWRRVEKSTPDKPLLYKVDWFSIPWSQSDEVTGFWLDWSIRDDHKPSGGKLRIDIFPDSTWDYIRIRNSEGTEIKRYDAGSRGDANLVNHSLYELVFGSDNRIHLNCIWRNNGTRNGDQSISNLLLAAEDIGSTVANLTRIGTGVA